MTYSASATDSRYCLGMMTARDDADLLDPAAWTKSPTPVFNTTPERQIFGPGHNSFTVDTSGRDVLVFQARDYDAITGDPLYDPNRHPRVERFRYRSDGIAGLAVGGTDCFSRTAGSLAKAWR